MLYVIPQPDSWAAWPFRDFCHYPMEPVIRHIQPGLLTSPQCDLPMANDHQTLKQTIDWFNKVDTQRRTDCCSSSVKMSTAAALIRLLSRAADTYLDTGSVHDENTSRSSSLKWQPEKEALLLSPGSSSFHPSQDHQQEEQTQFSP